jgi:hypothetical protein
MLDFRSLIVFSCGSLGAFAPQTLETCDEKRLLWPRLAPCLKMCLKQCFVHIERIEYAKTYSSYPKIIGTHGKIHTQKAQQLRVTNSFSKINAWMPYIQSTTAHVCNYIWGCSGETRGRHMLNGFQGPEPIFTRCPEIPQLLPWLQPRWNDSQPGTTTGGNDQMMSGS